jgi:hypothetical protein
MINEQEQFRAMEFSYSDYEAAEFVNFFWSTKPKFYENANCSNLGFDYFFPKKGQSNYAKRAIEICMGCSERFICLKYAMEQKLEDGIWGGTTPMQRQRLWSENVTVEEAWKNLE